MKPKENIETRMKMSNMHNDLRSKLDKAYSKKQYVEVCWLCYSIFEQRINRIIYKYIAKCKKQKYSKPISISTRLICVKKVINTECKPFSYLDISLFKEIESWCKKRNDLVHSLLKLDSYKQFDCNFKELAKQGYQMVGDLYEQCNKFRNEWYKTKRINCKFPLEKCKCKTKCIDVKSF